LSEILVPEGVVNTVVPPEGVVKTVAPLEAITFTRDVTSDGFSAGIIFSTTPVRSGDFAGEL
jgi:hypothetical protein